ncbi:hypothetical protein, partial [Enterobacter hormaechei]|uniref:hypothetical protein n=2 Tax=Enterobacter hormaechei TaxID=158836 RepID=UPI002E2CF968
QVNLTVLKPAAKMVIVVTTSERDEATGQNRLIASHGVEEETGKKVILPPEHPSDIGAQFNTDLQSWVIQP